MCVSSSVYPVIIGNMRGTRQMLPDPDWKAEDQREARPRTSGGNNNDNDNQVGCSKRSPTDEKLRIETQRKSSPDQEK